MGFSVTGLPGRTSLVLGLVLALLGALGQVAIAFMGLAIGGMSLVVVLLAVDAVVAVAGRLSW